MQEAKSLEAGGIAPRVDRWEAADKTALVLGKLFRFNLGNPKGRMASS